MTPCAIPTGNADSVILGGSCYFHDIWRGRAQPGFRRAELVPGSSSLSEEPGPRERKEVTGHQ